MRPGCTFCRRGPFHPACEIIRIIPRFALRAPRLDCKHESLQDILTHGSSPWFPLRGCATAPWALTCLSPLYMSNTTLATLRCSPVSTALSPASLWPTLSYHFEQSKKASNVCVCSPGTLPLLCPPAAVSPDAGRSGGWSVERRYRASAVRRLGPICNSDQQPPQQRSSGSVSAHTSPRGSWAL